MTEEQIELAKRAVACKVWRWMPGMLTSHGARYLGFDLWVDRGQRVAVFADPDEGEVPDLTDPATLGCLLALVREAHGPRCYTQACGGYWTVQNEDTDDWWGKNCVYEAEALIAALEAAP